MDPAWKQIYFVEAEPTSPSSKRGAKVAEAWRKEFKQEGEPDPTILYAFDMLQVLARAARGAGGDVQKVLVALRGTRLEGASGVVSFEDVDGGPEGD